MATALDGAGSGDRSSSLSPSLDLATARQAVEDLLQFRNTYLEGTAQEFGLFNETPAVDGLWTDRTVLKRLLDRVQTQSQEKSQSVWHKFTTTVNLLRQLEPGFANGSPQEKSEFCYLNGKAMNAILSSEDDDDYAHSDSTGNNCGVAVVEGDEQGDDGTSSPKQSRNPEILLDRGNLVSTAVRWLTRALKFNPQLTEAWCELGECYWRQGDLSTAQQHFNQALKIDANHAEAMCQLSMLLRHLPAATTATSLTSDEAVAGGGSTEVAPLSTAEKVETATTRSHLGESLRLAHAAVQLRPWDGHTWLILGNALLTAFFADPLAPFGLPAPLAGQTDVDVKSTSASTKTQLMMSRCLAAYAQAAKQTSSTLLEPNFHFNRGLAYHFQDMFSQCLTSWLRAVCLDPHWPNPRSRAVRLANFLLAVADLAGPRSSGEQEDEDWEAFTYPLAACLCLKPGDSEPVASVEPPTATATRRKKKKPALSDRQLANSLARLLGPYCASVAGHETGQTAARWVTMTTASERRRRTRKAQKKCRPGGEEVNTRPPGDKAVVWRLVYFNELQTGANQGCLCVGRLVRRLPTDSVLAVNLLLLDALNQPITVRLCNVGEDLGPADKDILVIPHPYVEEREVDVRLLRAAHTVDSHLSGSGPAAAAAESSSTPKHHITEDILLSQLRLEDKGSKQEGERDSPSVLRVRFIRVPLPNLLVVNGQPVGSKWTATPVLQNVFFTPV